MSGRRARLALADMFPVRSRVRLLSDELAKQHGGKGGRSSQRPLHYIVLGLDRERGCCVIQALGRKNPPEVKPMGALRPVPGPMHSVSKEDAQLVTAMLARETSALRNVEPTVDLRTRAAILAQPCEDSADDPSELDSRALLWAEHDSATDLAPITLPMCNPLFEVSGTDELAKPDGVDLGEAAEGATANEEHEHKLGQTSNAPAPKSWTLEEAHETIDEDETQFHTVTEVGEESEAWFEMQPTELGGYKEPDDDIQSKEAPSNIQEPEALGVPEESESLGKSVGEARSDSQTNEDPPFHAHDQPLEEELVESEANFARDNITVEDTAVPMGTSNRMSTGDELEEETGTTERGGEMLESSHALDGPLEGLEIPPDNPADRSGLDALDFQDNAAESASPDDATSLETVANDQVAELVENENENLADTDEGDGEVKDTVTEDASHHAEAPSNEQDQDSGDQERVPLVGEEKEEALEENPQPDDIASAMHVEVPPAVVDVESSADANSGDVEEESWPDWMTPELIQEHKQATEELRRTNDDAALAMSIVRQESEGDGYTGAADLGFAEGRKRTADASSMEEATLAMAHDLAGKYFTRRSKRLATDG